MPTSRAGRSILSNTFFYFLSFHNSHSHSVKYIHITPYSAHVHMCVVCVFVNVGAHPIVNMWRSEGNFEGGGSLHPLWVPRIKSRHQACCPSSLPVEPSRQHHIMVSMSISLSWSASSILHDYLHDFFGETANGIRFDSLFLGSVVYLCGYWVIGVVRLWL